MIAAAARSTSLLLPTNVEMEAWKSSVPLSTLRSREWASFGLKVATGASAAFRMPSSALFDLSETTKTRMAAAMRAPAARKAHFSMGSPRER